MGYADSNDSEGTRAANAANSDIIVAAVNALHAIAPGRELEAAKALVGIVGALREITETKGRFSLDHKQHAINTIEDMKQLAVDALAALDGKST